MGRLRGAVLVVSLVGCGRFHFQSTDDADAGVDVDVGAAPIGNVCSGDEPCTVADSVRDWAITQGHLGWYYGYWNESVDTDGVYQATDFSPLVWMAESNWRPPDWQPTGPTYTWAYLQRWGGHPGAMPTPKLPIRRWVSNVSGATEAVIHHAKSDRSGGDGTRAILFVDGVQVFSRDIAGTDGVGFTDIVPIDVAIGTKLDLMLHFIGGEGRDTTNSSMIIRSR